MQGFGEKGISAIYCDTNKVYNAIFCDTKRSKITYFTTITTAFQPIIFEQ